MATNIEILDYIYKKYPDLYGKIKNSINREIEYDFIEHNLIKDYGTMNQGRYRCVDYAKIIPKVKYPEEHIWTKDKLERNKYNEVDNPVAFLVAGTIIDVEKEDDGSYSIFITDDEQLWNNPDDYDRLVHVNKLRQVFHCIVVNNFFDRKQNDYSIGNIENLHPGKRAMMSVFYLEPTSNENWLQAAFTDIKYCSRDLSFSSEYYKVKLDNQFKLITNDEFFERFIALAQENGVTDLSSTNNDNKNSDGCYIATAVYGSYNCPQVWTLRRYRDNSLAKTWYGRAFIKLYYAVSPMLVKLFGNSGWFINLFKPKLDNMVHKLNSNGFENTPYNDQKW